MMLGNPLLLTSDDAGYQVSRSLRFRASASARLTRTPASAGNRKTMTFSLWVKRGRLGVASYTIFGIGTTVFIRFSDDSGGDTIRIYGGAGVLDLITAVKFRDPSAWAHLVVAIDTTQATASNRIKIYWNNQQITNLAATTYPTLNLDTGFNTASASVIGALDTAEYFDGYMTEFYFIDGQALTPSSFGETDTITGVWKPKKYAGTYGTNGFYLNFSDPSAATAAAIGKDYSGNGNNWTPNNISVTSGATYDSMLDVPTPWADGGNGRGNYAVINPLETAGTYSNANLTFASSTTATIVGRPTISVTSGKWYWEATCVSSTSSNYMIGVSDTLVNQLNGSPFGIYGWGYFGVNGNKYNNSIAAAYGATYTNNDVIGVALDMDVGELTFYKNGVSQGVAYTGLTGKQLSPSFSSANSVSSTYAINFGQRPFAYTPPSGFKALNTQNLPEPAIVDGRKQFNAVLYTGNGSTQSITGVGFQPDLVWTKGRGSATFNNHLLYDHVRGVQRIIQSNSTAAEGVVSNGLTSFNSNGFSIGSFEDGNTNNNAYVAWNWKESPSAGFDIVTYTGNGSTQNIAHSLGVAPAMIIVKSRSLAATPWESYHRSLGQGTRIRLNETSAASADTSVWNNTAPTSSVFSIGNQGNVNTNGETHVAYLFAEVAGFSRFGSYTGTGSADGPFVFCGFRPKFVMIKRTDSTGSWDIFDTSRDPYNASGLVLYPNNSIAEQNFSPFGDLLSNGFKVRNGSATDFNASGGTYIFAAFAESPFKYSLAR